MAAARQLDRRRAPGSLALRHESFDLAVFPAGRRNPDRRASRPTALEAHEAGPDTAQERKTRRIMELAGAGRASTRRQLGRPRPATNGPPHHRVRVNVPESGAVGRRCPAVASAATDDPRRASKHREPDHGPADRPDGRADVRIAHSAHVPSPRAYAGEPYRTAVNYNPMLQSRGLALIVFRA